MEVVAVFDIGKTNKKFFLFDENLLEVYREYATFELVKDEDGYPTENLSVLTEWIKATFHKAFIDIRFDITSLNFSTYGASFVHLGYDGKPLTPLYNYTKPLPAKISAEFYEKYGPESVFTATTGSTNSGMLNSGMQLFWLKNVKPEVFSQIGYSLHLPQYLSYLFTKEPVTEYTSIGCHTALWDFTTHRYHRWVYEEEIDNLFPPISNTTRVVEVVYLGRKLRVGIGIHDSSAALLAYIKKNAQPFVLLSTGTWNVSLNPFSSNPIIRSNETEESILYMQVDGSAVKSNRIFLGNEFNEQLKPLAAHYGVPVECHKNVKFNEAVFLNLHRKNERYFRWKSISCEKQVKKTRYPHLTFAEAYLQLLYELIELQSTSLRSTIGGDETHTIYVDGGFATNEIFIKLLEKNFPELTIIVSENAFGSALGAALCVFSKTSSEISS